MSASETTIAKVHHWVTDHFPLARERGIGVDDSLLDSGIIDSMGTLDVVEYLEDAFGLEITDEEMMAEHFDSVRAITALVESKQQGTSDE